MRQLTGLTPTTQLLKKGSRQDAQLEIKNTKEYQKAVLLSSKNFQDLGRSEVSRVGVPVFLLTLYCIYETTHWGILILVSSYPFYFMQRLFTIRITLQTLSIPFFRVIKNLQCSYKL